MFISFGAGPTLVPPGLNAYNNTVGIIDELCSAGIVCDEKTINWSRGLKLLDLEQLGFVSYTIGLEQLYLPCEQVKFDLGSRKHESNFVEHPDYVSR